MEGQSSWSGQAAPGQGREEVAQDSSQVRYRRFSLSGELSIHAFSPPAPGARTLPDCPPAPRPMCGCPTPARLRFPVPPSLWQDPPPWVLTADPRPPLHPSAPGTWGSAWGLAGPGSARCSRGGNTGAPAPGGWENHALCLEQSVLSCRGAAGAGLMGRYPRLLPSARGPWEGGQRGAEPRPQESEGPSRPHLPPFPPSPGWVPASPIWGGPRPCPAHPQALCTHLSSCPP